mmetsp:Transcript_73496/g.226952  ORF Transcript_73496/g.226952 Transcript_73496/m.226952 type:complete len:224 (-) Transcript_73496:58-729(-)
MNIPRLRRLVRIHADPHQAVLREEAAKSPTGTWQHEHVDPCIPLEPIQEKRAIHVLLYYGSGGPESRGSFPQLGGAPCQKYAVAMGAAVGLHNDSRGLGPEGLLADALEVGARQPPGPGPEVHLPALQGLGQRDLAAGLLHPREVREELASLEPLQLLRQILLLHHPDNGAAGAPAHAPTEGLDGHGDGVLVLPRAGHIDERRPATQGGVLAGAAPGRAAGAQ